MKRDRDQTNFRKVRKSYEHSEPGCPFCHTPQDRILQENELAFAIRDAFPVSASHTLVIPKHHVSDVFDLSRSEINAYNEILLKVKQEIEATDQHVGGFNIGINNGETAGQTIGHCHIHLIPRRKADVENPVGGVRNIFPGKGPY
jgi:diadenosine tetraphosphate (Ap4A) HIT family hydrolase